MEQKRLCPFCMGELPPAATVCPHCGKILEGCNPAGCLPVGTVLALSLIHISEPTRP